MTGSNSFESGQSEPPDAKETARTSESAGDEKFAGGLGSDADELPEVWEKMYNELHALARSYMAREDRRITLQPTALVHEAFLKLSRQRPGTLQWRDNSHLFRIAASAMRQILVDHARRRKSSRQGQLRVSLSSAQEAADASSLAEEVDILGLDDALHELAALDERKARVVELRFFGGLTGRQIGEALGISPKTVEADWYFSRSWLRWKLTSEHGGS